MKPLCEPSRGNECVGGVHLRFVSDSDRLEVGPENLAEVSAGVLRLPDIDHTEPVRTLAGSVGQKSRGYYDAAQAFEAVGVSV
jgi:hypothetical protein